MQWCIIFHKTRKPCMKGFSNIYEINIFLYFLYCPPPRTSSFSSCLFFLFSLYFFLFHCFSSFSIFFLSFFSFSSLFIFLPIPLKNLAADLEIPILKGKFGSFYISLDQTNLMANGPLVNHNKDQKT